jgi:hypothetical protein
MRSDGALPLLWSSSLLTTGLGFQSSMSLLLLLAAADQAI